MAYQVLARKYRPQRFSDVVGQDHVTRTLGNALEGNRIAHGYIFSGHRGIGKTTIARILAMALNCRRTIGSAERPTYEPCGTCESCEEVRTGNAVDVIEIDAATNRGIDEIRELRDAARYRPARDRYKIYILDEAHQITDAAFNALLKTLEEPPDHVVFMMATTQPEDILQTIRSRCQHFSFHAVKFDAILAQLRTIARDEQVDAEDEALALLAEAGDGSMRDALSIMDQAIASAPLVKSVQLVPLVASESDTHGAQAGRATLKAEQIRELMGSMPNAVFARLLEQVSENNSAAVLGELDRLLGAGNSPSQIARQLVRYLRNVLMARIGGESTELLQVSPDERARAAATALLFGEEELLRFLQVMLRTFDELNYRQEQRFHLELGVLKLVHLQRLLPVEELLTQLGGGAPAAGRPALLAASLARGAGFVSPVDPATPAGTRPAASLPSKAPVPAVGSGKPKNEKDNANNKNGEAAPAFSPFEMDAQRKTMPGIRTQPTQLTQLTQPVAALPAREPAVAPLQTQQIEPQRAPAAMPVPSEPQRDEPSREPLDLQAAPANPVTAAPLAPGEPQAAPAPTSGKLDLQAMREAACTALEAAELYTAATLLGAATWSETSEKVRVEVAAKKTMLGLTINPEADKLARGAMRPFLGHPPRPVEWVPGEGGSVKVSPPPRPAATGSVQALAMENPLVQQARELFGAEVRSVVDLRGKR